MRAIQVIFLILGACLAFDKARFQRTIEIREKNSNIHRSLFQSKEEQKAVARSHGHDDDPTERNVFYRPQMNPPSIPAPIALMTSAPVTIAPVSVAQKSILKILIEDVPPSSILLAMIAALDLSLLFDSDDLPGSITLIAPTDSAFQDGLSPEDLAYFTELYENPIWENHLACFVLYHTFDVELLTTANFIDGQLVTTVWVDESSVLLGTNPFSVNSIPLTQVDILATNGVVQVISQTPLRLPCTSDSILAQATQSQDLNTLLSLVNSAGLEAFLSNDAPMTLFAPTEAAFSSIASDILFFLIDPRNNDSLRELLLYHTLPQLLFLGNETEAGVYTTAALGELTMTVEYMLPGNFSIVGGSSINVANVASDGLNVLAKNGVIHLIDQVLIPPGFSVSLEPATSPATLAPMITAPATTSTSPPVDGSPVFTIAPTTAPPTDSTSDPLATFLTSLTDEAMLLSPGTVQNTAYQALAVTNPELDPSSATDQPIIAQRYSLYTLYLATSFNNGWTEQTGWLTEALYCSDSGNWFGITCAPDLIQITEIVVNANGLSGFIPSEIRGMSSLRRLEMANDANGLSFLTGEIPSSIGQMIALETINLSANSLGFQFPQGEQPIPLPNALPASLANLVNLQTFNIGNNFFLEALDFARYVPMTSLQILDLSVNIFTGTIPTMIGGLPPTLTSLSLDTNPLVGIIPTELGVLVGLQSLRISRSDTSDAGLADGTCLLGQGPCLDGTIPTEIGNLVNLVELWMFENSLGGPIPSEIGNCVLLERLIMFSNELSGVVPTEIGNLGSLATLDLSTNLLGQSITQELFELRSLVNLNLRQNVFNNTVIPESFNLPNIQVMRLDDNFFTGTVPPTVGSLATLQVFNVNLNRISGVLPTELGAVPGLQILDLGSNFISGTIPTEYGSFSVLQELILEINLLNGTIPIELGNLGATLQDLELAANDFSGTIPTTLGLLVNLQDLELTNNSLEGRIPTELGALTALLDLELDINNIVGPIPLEISKLTSLQTLRLELTSLTGAVPDGVCALTTSGDLTTFVTDCGVPAEVTCPCCTSCTGAIERRKG